MTAALVGDRPARQRGTGADSFTPGRGALLQRIGIDELVALLQQERI